LTDETSSAVVDRIVDGQAVLLVGEEETELVVPAGALPDGVGEGDWVLVRPGAEPVVTGRAPAEVDPSDLKDRMSRLRQDRRGGRFGC
jgi:hypothetical protein